MHATSVYIAREQFIHHQTVECTQARSKDFHTHVVRALLHMRVFMNFKWSCTVGCSVSYELMAGINYRQIIGTCIQNNIRIN